MRKAEWWHSLDDGRVACDLCPTACRLVDGHDGPCATRGHRDGRMQLLTYGRVAASGLDPIEKKPLFHFHPGSRIFSIAAAGCNLHCRFCQNWQLSQAQTPEGPVTSPQEIVAAARDCGSIGIAFTYSEPLVWYEFVRDTAAAAHAAGLLNVIVSNGYLQPEPLRDLLPLIDAVNLDLKAVDDDFYRKVCGARLEPVLASMRQIHEAGIHLEITNLVIPGYNDSPQQLRAVAEVIADLDPDIPLHLSAYHPAWHFDAPATPLATLKNAAEIARKVLHHVFIGNVNLYGAADTRCPKCQRVVVARDGFRARPDPGFDGRCPGCGQEIPMVLADPGHA